MFVVYRSAGTAFFFEKSTRWSSCTAVARRFLISKTRSCESASRVKHSVSCHQTRALRIKIGGNITSHQQLHKPCKVTSRRVLSQKARGVHCPVEIGTWFLASCSTSWMTWLERLICGKWKAGHVEVTGMWMWLMWPTDFAWKASMQWKSARWFSFSRKINVNDKTGRCGNESAGRLKHCFSLQISKSHQCNISRLSGLRQGATAGHGLE